MVMNGGGFTVGRSCLMRLTVVQFQMIGFVDCDRENERWIHTNKKITHMEQMSEYILKLNLETISGWFYLENKKEKKMSRVVWGMYMWLMCSMTAVSEESSNKATNYNLLDHLHQQKKWRVFNKENREKKRLKQNYQLWYVKFRANIYLIY